jgi:hypothetical protein
MRRRLIRFALCLILGPIVNVAVTWIIVERYVYLGISEDGNRSSAADSADWKEFPPDGFAHPLTDHLYAFKGVGLDCAVLVPNGRFDGREYGSVLHAGWPVRSLAYAEFARQSSGNGLQISRWALKIGPFLGHDMGLSLPLKPIWPGFAINTVFYAAVLWVLLALPGAVRRFVRRRRGRCTRCDYDLRGQVADSNGHILCPECGTIA